MAGAERRAASVSFPHFGRLQFSVLQSVLIVRQPIYQVGSDQGLLAAPVKLDQLLVAPGERADVVIDFSDPSLWGQTIIFRNNAKGPYPSGDAVDPQTTGQIMAFRVSVPKSVVPDAVLPATLTTIASLGSAANSRDLALYENVDSYERLIQQLGTLSGPEDFSAPITEKIKVGDTEIWRIYNTTEDTHPIHLHQVSFQVVSRQKFDFTIDPVTGGVIVQGLVGSPHKPDANEAGWKDTVRMNPGEVTIIEAKFDLAGKYVWHCHILEHEEHDMMRFFEVAPAASLTPALTSVAVATPSITSPAVQSIIAPTTLVAAPAPVVRTDRRIEVLENILGGMLPTTGSRVKSSEEAFDNLFADSQAEPLVGPLTRPIALARS